MKRFFTWLAYHLFIYLWVVRDGQEIANGLHLDSLRSNKDSVKEIKEGNDCGIGIKRFKDFETGDVLQTYKPNVE